VTLTFDLLTPGSESTNAFPATAHLTHNNPLVHPTHHSKRQLYQFSRFSPTDTCSPYTSHTMTHYFPQNIAPSRGVSGPHLTIDPADPPPQRILDQISRFSTTDRPTDSTTTEIQPVSTTYRSLKLAFHDADTDTDILARMSWNALQSDARQKNAPLSNERRNDQ